MSTCAVVQDTLVINIIVAEPTDVPPEGCTLVLIPSDLPVQIGYTYVEPYFYDLDGNVVTPIIEAIDGE